MHNGELEAFNDLAESFAKKELLAHVHEREFPYALDAAEAVEAAREAGLLSVNLPADWGGTGLDASVLAGMLSRISIVDAGIAGILFTHAAALEIISAAVDRGDCAEVCRLVSGREGSPLAFQVYGGPGEIELPAVAGEGVNQLSGRLPLVALGRMARHAVVPGARPGGEKFSWYLVDLSLDGVKKSDPVLTLGMQACQAVDIELDAVPALLLGAEGQGGAYFRTMQARMSAGAAAISLGIMEGSFREALAYARQRWQGGRYLEEWSGVRMMLARMAVQIEVSRCCLAGCGIAGNGAAFGGEGSALAAALHISELACAATSEGVQLLGGNGYMKDYGQEKRMRDARQARCLLGMGGLRMMSFIGTIMEEARA